jgi:hypothetical protein
VSDIQKTKRTQLSWNQEYKSAVPDIKDFIKIATGKTPSNLEVFRLCLAYGFYSGKKNDVPPRAADVTNVNYIKDLELAEMQAIALTETEDSTILLREDDVFDVAESYASGGLELLAHEISNQADFGAWLTSLLWRPLEKFEETLKKGPEIAS